MSDQSDDAHEKDNEIGYKRNIWCSTEVDEIVNNEFKIMCLKWDLEILRNKGFQKPKLTIYLMIIFSATSFAVILLVYGYATNWDGFSFFPLFLSQIVLQSLYFHELGQTSQSQLEKTKFQKIFILTVKAMMGIFSAFSVVYAAIFKPLFNSPALYMASIFPNTIIICFVICLASDYDNLPNTYFSNKNINNNKILRKSFSTGSKKHTQYIIQTRKKSRFTFEIDEFDEWGALKQRFWTAIVTSIMFIDVISDVYYGYLLFSTYRALSALLRISGIALIACCCVDLFYVIFMLLFPGWVSHFAHTIAFIMELPNFVLTGISIWKVQQLIKQDIVEDSKSQQLAIFSVISTSLNALIHIMYIVDRWAVKNAIEFIQQQ